jgi:hypothetical protein
LALCLHSPYRLEMLDAGRSREIVHDQAAPFLEIGGAAKGNGMVLDRFPLHEQAVALRFLDAALEFDTLAALSAQE